MEIDQSPLSVGTCCIAALTAAWLSIGGALAQTTSTTPPARPAAAAAPTAPPATVEQPAEPLSDMAFAIRGRIEIDEGTGSGAGADQRVLTLYSFYEERNYKPIWVTTDGALEKAVDFVEILENANLDALHVGDYRVAQLETQLAAKAPLHLASLEIALSKTLLEYTQHLSAGRVVPHKINSEINVFPEAEDAADVLNGAEASDDIDIYITSLAPQTPNYARLKIALDAFRSKAAHGGWTKVPPGTTLKPDEENAALVAVLRTRMIEGDDLVEGAHLGDIYNGALVMAVRNFQYRHGLEIDGVIGPATYGAINVPLATRVEQMELNMERRRWMEDNLGDYYIFVNLADQYLKVVSKGKTLHTTPVVIGKPYFRTPVFSETMTYVVLNPYWNVPYSIAVNEYLPKLKRNPGVLASQNIRLLSNGAEVSPRRINWQNYRRGNFPFRLRQDPGGRNALGRVKFMFPNRFNVYLHDTPSKSLFTRASRAFSHGCIRVKNPFDLAEVLLESEGWSRPKIDAAVRTGKKRIVKLKRPISVHITYLTAWVNKDGSVHFRDDVYERDKRLSVALNRVKKPL